MKTLKIGLLAAALVVAAGLGAAVAPAAHGQGTVARPRVASRALDLLGARGGAIGVSIRDLDDADVKGAKGAQGGVVIEDVSEDSPAATAGMKKGDIVVEFDGERVRSVRQFTRLVSETPAGRKVSAALLRDGQRVTVSVAPRENDGFRLLDLPNMRVLENFGGDFAMRVPPVPPVPPGRPAPPAAPAPPAFPDIETFIWRAGTTLGMTASDLSDQLAAYFGTKDGVLVTSVTEGSPAAKAGLKAGDVITSLNGSAVASSSELRRRLQRMGSSDDFTIDVVRDKKTVTLKGKLEEQQNRRTFRSIV